MNDDNHTTTSSALAAIGAFLLVIASVICIVGLFMTKGLSFAEKAFYTGFGIGVIGAVIIVTAVIFHWFEARERVYDGQLEDFILDDEEPGIPASHVDDGGWGDHWADTGDLTEDIRNSGPERNGD